MSVGREVEDLRKRLDWMEAQVAKLPSRLSQNVGGGGSGASSENAATWVEAESYPALVGADTVDLTTFARVTAGDQKDQIYKVATNADDELYWKCIDENYEADSKAELVNNAYVQVFALGRVDSIYYRRNASNTDWEAQNEFE